MNQELQDQAIKHAAIVEYIINKNSHPLPRGVDFENAYEEMQDFLLYLWTKECV